MSRKYLRGEIYYADLDPVVGSEQMGTRPVLILQNNVGNHFARTVIVAPITSRIHTKSKIPTHSNIGMIGRMKYPSVVMLEQLRTLDKRRIGYYIGKLPEEKMQDVTRALCVSLAIRRKECDPQWKNCLPGRKLPNCWGSASRLWMRRGTAASSPMCSMFPMAAFSLPAPAFRNMWPSVRTEQSPWRRKRPTAMCERIIRTFEELPPI